LSKRPIIRQGSGGSQVQSFSEVISNVNNVPRTLSAAERKREVDRRSIEYAREEGRHLGYKEGVAAGYEMGKLQGVVEGHQKHADDVAGVLDEFRTKLLEAVEGVYAARRAMLIEIEEVLGGLSIDIASRVVAKHVEVDPAVALEIAREAIREVTHATKARVRVNPFGSAIVRSHVNELMALSPTLRGVEIVDDPAIDGGCVIESEGGIIDARIAARLANLVQAAQSEDAA